MATQENPVCGDQVKVMLKLNTQNRIDEIKFIAKGCAICVASASIMTGLVQSNTIPGAQDTAAHIIDTLQGRYPIDQLDQYGDLRAFKKLPDHPVRIKCALLCWHALEEGLDIGS